MMRYFWEAFLEAVIVGVGVLLIVACMVALIGGIAIAATTGNMWFVWLSVGGFLVGCAVYAMREL